MDSLNGSLIGQPDPYYKDKPDNRRIICILMREFGDLSADGINLESDDEWIDKYRSDEPKQLKFFEDLAVEMLGGPHAW